jgi:hypothetical protein
MDTLLARDAASDGEWEEEDESEEEFILTIEDCRPLQQAAIIIVVRKNIPLATVGDFWENVHLQLVETSGKFIPQPSSEPI